MHFAHILQNNSKCWHWDNRKIPASYVDMQNQLMQCWIQTNMVILGASMNINAFMMIMMTSCNGTLGFHHLLPFGKPRASRYKGPVTWSSSVLFDVSLNTEWTNSRADDDLRGRDTHVTSHQHRFLFRLSDGVSEMPDEISRNLASLHMSMWNWKDTHAGVHPPYDRYVALKLERYHGAILFGGNCRHRGLL